MSTSRWRSAKVASRSVAVARCCPFCLEVGRARAACRAPPPATRCWHRSRRQSPARAASSFGSSGVLPPITMLTSCGQGRRPIAAICSGVVGASTKPTSAPASRKACARSIAASKPSTAIASVRATIIRSGSVRASTAALILPTISAAGITSLPSKWPQRFGKHLVLDLDRVGAGALQRLDRAPHVERVAEAGVGVDHQRAGEHVADRARRGRSARSA